LFKVLPICQKFVETNPDAIFIRESDMGVGMPNFFAKELNNTRPIGTSSKIYLLYIVEGPFGPPSLA
jgi:hypothetical protein